jgi:hypothetical protein
MTKCKRCNGSGTATYHRADGLAIVYPCHACDGAGENMTNFDRIMLRMTIEQMAEDRTRSYEEPDRYDDSEITVYCNDAGRWLDWTDAIQAEIEWLKSEVET